LPVQRNKAWNFFYTARATRRPKSNEYGLSMKGLQLNLFAGNRGKSSVGCKAICLTSRHPQGK